MLRGETASIVRYSVATAGALGVAALIGYGISSDAAITRLLTAAGLPLVVFVAILAFGLYLARAHPVRHTRAVTAIGLVAMTGYVVMTLTFLGLLGLSHGLLHSVSSFYAIYGAASVGLGFGVLVGHFYVQQRRQADRLREANEELRTQNERLDEFASILSHDLRNPLAVASGYVEIAKKTENLQHLDEVEACHDRIETLIDQVLALARNERDPDAVDDVDVAGVATDALETVDVDGGEVVVDSSTTVRAERTDLRQVFENLYRNAAEHAGPNPTILVEALADGSGFAVEDDGPGIAPPERDKIFERGYSEGSGTGLGLAIVREIADTYGWDVSVTEGRDGGARFEFQTTATDVDAGEGSAVPAEAGPDDGGGVRNASAS